MITGFKLSFDKRMAVLNGRQLIAVPSSQDCYGNYGKCALYSRACSIGHVRTVRAGLGGEASYIVWTDARKVKDSQ